MSTTLVLLVVLIVMSAYFSATETAFSSLNKIKMKTMAAAGDKRADLVVRLSDDYDKLLSTILIGNNIVNILSTALATSLFTQMLGDAGVSVSTVVMTVLVLVFGEISPKSIAKDMPESFAMFSAPIIHVLIRLLMPLNYIFGQWKKLISRLFKSKREEGITEEELLTIVEEAKQDGGIDENEGELIRNAIAFTDAEVSDIFTPRIDVTAVEDTLSKEEISAVFQESDFSRLPVYHETIDDIVGIIHEKDFHNFVENTEQPLETIMQPALFVPPSMKISKLLAMLQQKKSHIAVVTDEFGGTAGIVTMEDILEELVGEIWDEHDEVVTEFEKISDTQYRIKCAASLKDMFELFGLDEEEAEEKDASTVGGWIVDELGKIPEEGEQLTYKNLEITVTHVKKQRVEEILVDRKEIAEESEEKDDGNE